MDYEKKYKEALKDMRAIYPNLKGDAKLAVEHAFPQLTESDDERILRVISEAVITFFSDYANDFEDEDRDAALAWLEKQKETSHIPGTCKENANSFIDGIIEVRSFQRGMEEGRKLERQKEQNGEDEFLEDELSAFLQNYDKEYDDDAAVSDVARHFYEIGKKQNEQKPHTDEEKEYIRTIKSIISDFICDKKPENLAYYQRIYDWLDGRHVPFSCSHENGKPEEWSEEDERMLRTIISDGSRGVELDSRQITWLKSLRPSWKPSEEQMEALKRASVNAYISDEQFVILASLYKQLKKLL